MAQDEGAGESVESHAEQAEGEAHGGGHEEHHHKNEIALVVGGTYESEEEETLFTLGAEYARTLSPVVTASFVVEHISGVDAWVFVAPVHFSPWRSSGFFFAAGPGVEHKSRRSHASIHGRMGPGPEQAEEGEDLFLWRTGIGYNFHVGKGLVIAPALDLDLVRENGEWVEAVVFDIAIGLGF